MFYRSLTDERTRRLHRARPVLALAGVAFATGALVGANQGGSPAYGLASGFVAAWAKGDYAKMYSDISASSRRSVSASEFAETYQNALTTATATSLQVAGKPRTAGDSLLAVPVRVNTSLFGALALSFRLRITEAGGESAAIAWSRSLSFPGMYPGELLSRNLTLPRRATLLARDRTVLAESAPGASEATLSGPVTRSSPLGEVASAVLGSVGPVPPERRPALEAQGVPAGATVGLSGVELALDDSLRGRPGGELLAGRRILASVSARPAPAVLSTVSPTLQRAAVTALGGQLGGIVAMEPATGQILAVAGIGLDGLQPPGSTFKIVTLTGVLAAAVANPHSVFPYATYARLDGVKLNNANGEECGGTLELAFAVSCNSVFAPLGVKLGSARLVATAERFGFNHDPGITGAAQSTLPAAGQIQGELDLGSTAIGQGQVLASPLEMAIVAATVADGGRRPSPTFELGAPRAAGVPVMSASVARTVRDLMIAVVRDGTGTSAAIPGVIVAGKTGTAELNTACSTSSEPSAAETAPKESGSPGCQGTGSEASNTDAWFAAFAPALHPRIVVAVLLVKDGAGGATAAPVARQVLEAELTAIR
ncbi:MAG: penicillin-binding transpeptidase domain-containing protein [Solirubrobacteraceae bacterium]|jgi:cell division protein FtsI/penicillin-binding protein 2